MESTESGKLGHLLYTYGIVVKGNGIFSDKAKRFEDIKTACAMAFDFYGYSPFVASADPAIAARN
jgi:hypothetical protein